MSQERFAAQTVNYSSPSTPQTSGHRRDSLVVTSENGETTVTYLSELFDFGDGIVQVQPTGSVAFSETSPIELMGRHRHDVSTISNVAGIDTTCAIGGIPYEESVTTTGARVYSIPFATAADLPFTPSVSLLYSSQAGSGVAGYGWHRPRSIIC